MSSQFLSSESTVLLNQLTTPELKNNCDSRMLISILEVSYDFVIIFDEKLFLLDCSKSFTDLFNAEHDLLIGKHLNYLAPEFQKKDLYGEFKLACDRRGFYEHDNFALDNPTLYKQPVFVRFRMFPLNSFVICAAEDITIQIQYDILRQKYLKLLDKNDQLESVLSSSDNKILKNNRIQTKNNVANLADILEKQKNFTTREIEVSMLIIKGKSTKEIATALFISNKAVNFHRSNIRKKLGITNSKISLKTYLLDL